MQSTLSLQISNPSLWAPIFRKSQETAGGVRAWGLDMGFSLKTWQVFSVNYVVSEHFTEVGAVSRC